MDLKLKTISTSAIDEAIAKAELYRSLNEPEEAESICRDILAADPNHQIGRRLLGLAITDQFTGEGADRYVGSRENFPKPRRSLRTPLLFRIALRTPRQSATPHRPRTPHVTAAPGTSPALLRRSGENPAAQLTMTPSCVGIAVSACCKATRISNGKEKSRRSMPLTTRRPDRSE